LDPSDEPVESAASLEAAPWFVALAGASLAVVAVGLHDSWAAVR